jgi:AraC family transcriptional regulator of adaptative response/methylated-DNA-[protein]-cysteine methyltransferase
MLENRDYQRIQRAIAYISEHYRDQPSLDEVAAAVHVSTPHFSRLFVQWAGISPKQYLRAVTLEHAKTAVRGSDDLLSASQRLGLSGPSRLHDLFVDLEAVTPGEFKTGGEGLEIRFGELDTPFGPCMAAATGRGLCAVSFLDTRNSAGGLAGLKADWPRAVFREDSSVTAGLHSTLQALLEGKTPEPLRVLVKGTNFQVQVWRALLGVAPGQTVSYGELAARLGRPAAARAIGSAVGANRIAFLIPCHRVLRAGGQLGGYRWGEERKRAMLTWEMVRHVGASAS